MKPYPRVLIILLNWNGKKDTLECLDSLSKVTYPKFQTIVVDNGSTDDSVSAIRTLFPQIPIFENGANLGFAAGNNVGISWGLKKNYEWILLLNNDTVVDPFFLDEFIKAALENPNAKILGAKIYQYGDPTRIDHLGGFWNPSVAEFESHGSNQIDDGISFECMKSVDYVCGAALLMHRSVPESIGLLEPKFFLFWEETDFCFRARRKGFEVWTAPKAKIWHKVSSSFSGGKPHMHYFWWRSRLLWIERNCTYQERKALYRNVLYPEIFKTFRHLFLRTLQIIWSRILLKQPKESNREKTRRYQAGLWGILHYATNQFGNCPSSLANRK